MIYSFFFVITGMMFFFIGLYFLVFDLVFMLEYEILNINSSMLVFSILLDWMSLLFASFVLFISSMVIFYSYEYMKGDLNINRFIILIFMFIFSMMFLIFSPNLISIMLGWDGLGLISYCLVIYYQNLKSFNSGMITVLSNRVGDVVLLISIAWMINFGSWNWIFYLDFMKNDVYLQLIMFFVILAALTKSAQIPFSSWLPAAMAAPTPISSLVHSSTLVTAGVYLLIRFNNLLVDNYMYMLLFISSLTMFMSGLIANFEYDLKKIIALSTLSQLGLMMSILALGEEVLAFFHLLMHALFKALLFMCAGSMIHNMNSCQDIRLMGSLINKIPLTSCFFVICNGALCGFPFLSGFYSKDLILEFMSMNFSSIYVYLIFYISIGLTLMYSLRLIFYILIKSYNGSSYFLCLDLHNEMLLSMLGIILFVIFGGSMTSWLVFSTPYFLCLPFLMKIMAFFFIILGIILGLIFSNYNLTDYSKTLYSFSILFFMSSLWNLSIFTLNFNRIFLLNGGKLFNFLDHGWSEYFGSQNLFNILKRESMIMQIIFNNNLKIFLILFLIWICLLLF
uniref:NADH-ubiquinone oxidoreductase chain 5 n=1 Tax=Platerodrilus sp. MNCN/DNA:86739 TaxID=1905348 RepID=A0A342Z5F1_9COLE|nr:NADH dehydrogenase subunit 5 [Platerodrilus sp. MNCN/DNA:86739]